MAYRTTAPVERCWVCEANCDQACRGCRRAICPAHTFPERFCRRCDEEYFAFVRSYDANTKVVVICLGMVLLAVALTARWPVLAVPSAVVAVASFPIVARALRLRRSRQFLEGKRDRETAAERRFEDDRDARDEAERRLLGRRANASDVE